MWNLTSFLMKTVLVSVQDRCMVCTICSIGLQIVLDEPLVPLDDEAQVEARLGLFGDSVTPDAR